MRYGCKQNWQLASLFDVQRRPSVRRVNGRSPFTVRYCRKLIKRRVAGQDRVGRAVQWAPPCEAAADSCSLMSLDWGGGAAAGHDHQYHPSCITGGRGRGSCWLSNTSTACTRSQHVSGLSLYHCVHQSLMVVCICKPVI